MQAQLLDLSEPTKTRLKTIFGGHFVVAFLPACFSLLVFLCPPILEVFRFFFSLMVSTGICFIAVYQFILFQNQQRGRGVLAVEGGDATWCDDQVMFCIKADHVDVGCLRTNSLNGWVEDESNKSHREDRFNGSKTGDAVEEISSQADGLAERVWNCYFGRYSRWHHQGSGAKEI